MRGFCPACDAVVSPQSADNPRCPQCHRKIEPQDIESSSTVGSSPARSRAVVGVSVVVVVVAALVAAAWWSQREAELPAPEAAIEAVVSEQQPAKTWQQQFAVAGFQGQRAQTPDQISDELRATAAELSNGAAIVSLFNKHLGVGKLQRQPSDQRRRHSVVSAATLWPQVLAAKARPVHDIEVAWLTATVARARGDSARFVVDRGGVQTPLLLVRTRVVSRLADGTFLNPLNTNLVRPEPIDDATVAGWWLLLRAHVQRTRGEFSEARADIEVAEKLLGDRPIIAFTRGLVALAQGMTDKGLQQCESALARQEDALARLVLADVLAAMRQPFKAYQHVNKALAAKEPLAEAWVSKGLLGIERLSTLPQAQRGAESKKIAEAFSKALELDDDVAGARAGLAQLKIIEEDLLGAEKLLVEAVERHRDTNAALLLAQMWLASRKVADAATMLEKIDRLDDERVVQTLSKALVALGRKEDALKVVGDAQRRFPELLSLAFLRVDLLRQLGQTEAAISALEPLFDSKEADAAAIAQTQIYLQAKQPDKALQSIAKVARRKPTDKSVVTLLLLARLQAGHSDEASVVAKRALDDGVLSELELAGLYLEIDDSDRATAVLELALNRRKPSREVVAMLAMIYVARGDKDKAIALRETMVKNAGEQADEMKSLVDKAIAGAEAELARRTAEQGVASDVPKAETQEILP